MCSGTGVLFCFILLISQITGLVELPKVDDNNILASEIVIRDTINALFSALRLKDLKNKPRLKEYSTVHNQLISFTLQDYNNLKEIAKLTRVVKNEINVDIINFMTSLNELLNEDSTENKEFVLNSNEDIAVDYIDEFLHKLEFLKEEYDVKHDDVRLKADIYKILKEEDLFMINYTSHEAGFNVTDDQDILLEDIAFWTPEKTKSRRVFHGERTKAKHFPFMASIQVFNSFQCGGSIIKSDLIITAASCLQLAYNNRLFRENPAFLSVRVGSDFYNGGNIVPVLEVYFHPEYNPKNLRNNICLLRLVRKLRFKKREKRVKKIDFDRSPTVLPEGTDGITIVGWGAQGTSNVVSNPWRNVLSFSLLDIYPMKECQAIYSKEYVTRKQFCAGFFSKGGGACNRDVGGPGIVDGILTGVVSFGSPICGAPDAPTVFTKLGYYTDWIETIMEQDVPGSYQRTTTRRPNLLTLPALFDPKWFQTKMINQFTMAPLKGAASPLSLKDADALRMLKNTDLFKEFLDTMFDSKEREQYQDILEMRDQFDQEVGRTKSLPELSIRHPTFMGQEVHSMQEISTAIIDFNHVTRGTEGPIIATPESISKIIPYMFDRPAMEEVKPIKNANEIKADLIKLLDNIDINKLIDNVSNLDGNKLVVDPKVLQLIEAKLNKNKSADLNESILTMLYLSDSEKKILNQEKLRKDTKDKPPIDEKLEEPFKDLTYRNNNSAILYDFKPDSELYNIISKKNKA